MQRITFADKMAKIGEFQPDQWLVNLYKKGYSADEIAEKLFNEYNISITSKSIAEKIKKIIPLRSYKERKINAIKRGRMIYIKKPKHEKYYTKSISAKVRLEILQRDGGACVICGNGPKNGYSIEIHHINGPDNTADNLQTLCFLCHRGTHAIKKEV